MKPTEKFKAQKTLKKIESGNFDENDIDSIFMALRAYSHGNRVFREIADFVAHNDKRVKGLTNESLEAFYLSFKYFTDYSSQDKILDIGAPFPIYIKKLMKYQIDKCEETVLKEKFNVTKQCLKSRIDTIFAEDKKNQTAFVKKPEISENTFNAIKHILGFIGSNPAFDQDQIVSALFQVIKANKLHVDVTEVLKYSDRIAICVMLLLHETKFEYYDKNQGYCKISCKNTTISYTKKEILGECKESFGNLFVMGYVEVENSGKNVTICYPLMTTNISAENWCDDNMFVFEKMGENGSTHLYKKIIFDAHLYFNENDKIGIIS